MSSWLKAALAGLATVLLSVAQHHPQGVEGALVDLGAEVSSQAAAGQKPTVESVEQDAEATGTGELIGGSAAGASMAAQINQSASGS